MKSVVIASLPLAFAACYGAAPPRPARIALPEPVEGGQIAVYSEQRTELETVQKRATTCPQGHAEGSPACSVTRYSATEPVTRTYTTATYADQPISYAQFKVMTDPHYDDKLAHLDELSRKCQRANVPRYAGLAGLVAGAIVGPLISSYNGTVGGAVMGIGLAGGAASYTLGYFAFGGRDCNRARALYHDVEVAGEVGTLSVTGAHLAAEMQELASRFNAGQARGADQSAMRMR